MTIREKAGTNFTYLHIFGVSARDLSRGLRLPPKEKKTKEVPSFDFSVFVQKRNSEVPWETGPTDELPAAESQPTTFRRNPTRVSHSDGCHGRRPVLSLTSPILSSIPLCPRLSAWDDKKNSSGLHSARQLLKRREQVERKLLDCFKGFSLGRQGWLKMVASRLDGCKANPGKQFNQVGIHPTTARGFYSSNHLGRAVGKKDRRLGTHNSIRFATIVQISSKFDLTESPLHYCGFLLRPAFSCCL